MIPRNFLKEVLLLNNPAHTIARELIGPDERIEGAMRCRGSVGRWWWGHVDI